MGALTAQPKYGNLDSQSSDLVRCMSLSETRKSELGVSVVATALRIPSFSLSSWQQLKKAGSRRTSNAQTGIRVETTKSPPTIVLPESTGLQARERLPWTLECMSPL